MPDILYMLVGGSTIYKFSLDTTVSLLGSCVLPNISPIPASPDLGYVLFLDTANDRLVAICQNVGNNNQIISTVTASTMTLIAQSSPFVSPTSLAPTTSGSFSNYSSTLDSNGNIWTQQPGFPVAQSLLVKINSTTFAITSSINMSTLFPATISSFTGINSYVDTNGICHILAVGAFITTTRYIASVNASTGVVEWQATLTDTESTGEQFPCADPATGNVYYCGGQNTTWNLYKINNGTVTQFVQTTTFSRGIPSLTMFDTTTGFVYCITDAGVVFIINPSTGAVVNIVGSGGSPLLDTSQSGLTSNRGGLPLTLSQPVIYNSVVSTHSLTTTGSSWYAFAANALAPNPPVITLFSALVAQQTFDLTQALPTLTSPMRGSFVIGPGAAPPPPTPPVTTTSVLTNVDTWELDNSPASNPTDTGTPIAWYENALDQQEFGIAPVPANDGTIGFLYVQLATALTGLGVNLVVPDDWTPYVMWGALAELLSSDGPSFDPVRASYCTQRYNEGIELARLVLGGSQ